jgi:SOS response regulatory protein OraA/RecX
LDAEEVSSAYARALDALTRYLALRDHSLYELRTKLGRRFEPELVEKLLNEAELNGWLTPEEQIAERLALSLARRHKSQMYIDGQLRQRGLPPVKTEAEGAGELESIRHLVERKFGTGPLSYDDKGKAYRFLKYRGFKDSAIRQVLNEERQG